MAFIFAQGPEVRKVSRKEAETAIRDRDDIPEDAEIAVAELAGHWVAAIHTAEFPPPKGGGPADADEEAPGPKSETPGDEEPSAGPVDTDSDGDTDGDTDGDSDGPPKHDEKGGEKHEIQALLTIVQSIAEALGIPDPTAAAGSPVPGEDVPPGLGGPPGAGGPPPGAGGPPPGAGAPPGHAGPPHGGGDQHQVIEHKRGLKPGEVPPGSTPIGAPSFSSVQTKDGQPHPWAPVISGPHKKATFETQPERIPETHTAEAVEAELTYLADGTGYKVKQVHIETDDTGHRIARALISSR